MSEGEQSAQAPDINGIQDELTPQAVQSVINSLGTRVVTDLKTQPQHATEDFTDEQVRHEYCRKINGEILAHLVNEYSVSGMIMTLQPVETEKFKLGNWKFHSVGIVSLGHERYAAYDQTNLDADGSWFFRTGTLDEVSQELDNFFGFHWDLSFTPSDNPKNTVRAKIENAKQLIQKHEHVTYNSHMMFAPLGIESKQAERPLGLKVMVPTDDLMIPTIRSLWTYGYA